MSETTYKVSGIHCQSCVANISESVQAVAGVASVDVSPEKEEVIVRGDSFDDAAVRSAIADAGYEAA
ncbi:MAG: heavy-metal-associated domain-containing protein [Actinomycetota bacterium]|nr:heavy-metal-associated domain-containing protein [Actinomycetota bacterium]